MCTRLLLSCTHREIFKTLPLLVSSGEFCETIRKCVETITDPLRDLGSIFITGARPRPGGRGRNRQLGHHDTSTGKIDMGLLNTGQQAA